LKQYYWICPFSVNQHAVGCKWLCGCTCTVAKNDKLFDEDKEINKFDDMMKYMKLEIICQQKNTRLKQVMACDENFIMLRRLWCVAECVEAEDSLIPQTVKIKTAGTLKHSWEKIHNFDVKKSEATDPNDIAMVMAKIHDPPVFNKKLRSLMQRRVKNMSYDGPFVATFGLTSLLEDVI
jgi:hypothetical protein